MAKSKKQIKEYYKNKYKIGRKEIIVKTLILRVISSLITAGLVFYLTGSFFTSATILWIDFIVKTAIYYAYEVVWLKYRAWFLGLFT